MRFILVLLFVLIFVSFWSERIHAINGTTYYISSEGSDLNSGKSEQEAWKSLDKINSMRFLPGDSILFRSGDIWIGQLSPKGSGTKDNYIYMGAYGKGRKPYIAGNGVSGILGGTILLYNQDYWKIQGMEISNIPKDNKEAVRFGILVRWHDYGTGKGIIIDDCRIHDISGLRSCRFHGDGIMIIGTGSSRQTGYEDIIIEGCELFNIDRTGINVWNQWNKRFGLDYGPVNSNEHYHGSSGEYIASRGVIVRNNYLENIAGDGIIVSCSNNAIIEKNKVFKANQRSSEPNVAIWTHNSDSVVMQYNETSYTAFSGDGQGYDIDMLCYDCISQYNYSHKNEGGFHLICSQGTKGRSSRNIVRYNKSVDDGRYLISLVGSIDSTYIYGNEFVVSDSTASGMFTSWEWDGGKPSNTFFCKNKISYRGKCVNAMKDTINFVSEDNIWQQY